MFSHVPGFAEKNRLAIIFGNAVARGRARFFSVQNTSSLSQYSAGDLGFGITGIFLTILHQWVDYNVVSIVYGALTLTFLLATKQFVTNNWSPVPVENEGRENILGKFNELKILTRSLNSIWAPLVLNVLIELALTIILLHRYVSTGHVLRFVHLLS